MAPTPDPTRLARLARELALLAAAATMLIGVGRAFAAGAPLAYHAISGALVLLGAALLARILGSGRRAAMLADTLAVLTAALAVVAVSLTPMRTWSAGTLLLLTLGLLLSDRLRRTWIAEALVIAPAMLAAVFIGLNVSQEKLGFAGMPWPVACAVLLAMIASILGRPDRGLGALLVAATEGGYLARRTVGSVLAVVTFLALVRIVLSHFELLVPATADRLYAFGVISVLATVLIRVSWRIDASDRARSVTERELRRSEGQARAITDSAPDAIVEIGADGLIVGVNPAAARLYGWSARELVGRSWALLLAAGDSDAERELFAQAMELMADSGTSADADFRHRDGHVVSVEFTASRIAGGFLTISRDVSGQRQFAATMREQSRRMTALAQAQARIAQGTGSLAERMELIAAAARELAAAGGAVIGLRDGGDLVCRAGVGAMDGWLDVRIPVGGSAACRAIAEDRLVVVADIEAGDQPPIVRGLCRDAGLRTLVALPLTEAGKEATLLVGHAEAGAFDDGALRTLELFAAMAATVLHRANVEHRLAVTNAIAVAAHADASLADGLTNTLEVLTEQLGWDAAGVWLAGHGGRRLHCAEYLVAGPVPAAPLAAVFERTVARGDDAPPATAFRDGVPVWLDLGVDALDRFRDDAARTAGLSVAVYVPLLVAGDVVGVLELLQRRSRSRDAGELELLTAVGTHVAGFVRRRQVELQVGEQAENLAAVVALSQMLAGIPASQVRFALCEGVREVARCDVVGIYEPGGDGVLRLGARSGAGVADGDETIDLAAPELVRQVFATGAGLHVGDVSLVEAHGDDFIRRTGMRAGHFEPVLRDGAVIAVLVMLSREPHEHDGIGDLALLLAAEASTALALADLVRALDAQARTDQLTGLANRRTWDEELPMELARAKRNRRAVSVAMLDLDHFKRYNDAFGHPAGDRLLRAVAAGWATRLRETDLLARYGGEEFGVVLPGCTVEAARLVLDELRLCMPDGTTCSIGIAEWDGYEDADTLVGRADGALYEAKRRGRDRIEAALPAT